MRLKLHEVNIAWFVAEICRRRMWPRTTKTKRRSWMKRMNQLPNPSPPPTGSQVPNQVWDYYQTTSSCRVCIGRTTTEYVELFFVSEAEAEEESEDEEDESVVDEEEMWESCFGRAVEQLLVCFTVDVVAEKTRVKTLWIHRNITKGRKQVWLTAKTTSTVLPIRFLSCTCKLAEKVRHSLNDEAISEEDERWTKSASWISIQCFDCWSRSSVMRSTTRSRTQTTSARRSLSPQVVALQLFLYVVNFSIF